MRVVFMGTPEFAVPSLRALAAEHEVAAVYTRADSASGRGSGLRPSPVKDAAAELGIPVIQPTTLRSTDVQRELASHAPDVVVVAAYGLILPREVLQAPRLGCVNVHASLLPRWRGAAPIQRAILAGDDVTGVSIMRMEEGLDTGPYCAVVSTPVAEKTTDELTDELARLGAEALTAALPRIEAGTCDWIEQDESAVTYAEKITKSDVALSPSLSTADFLRRVRASSRQAPARASVDGRGVTVVAACASDRSVAPGTVALATGAIVLGTADGAVSLAAVKPDGKAVMDGTAWARGVRLTTNPTWSAVS